jgi:hypothetical protein
MKSIFLILFTGLIYFPELSSQGCSDAGICSVPSLRPGAKLQGTEALRIMHWGMSVGAADHEILAISPYIGSISKLGSKFSFDSRINAMMLSGNGITRIGLGDVYINLNYHPDVHWSFSGGLKLPSSRADKEKDGKVLPMDYQTTLGTMDLITGISYRKNDFQATLAWQQPLRQNRNDFNPEVWLPDTTFADFQNTLDYTRKGDLMLRLSQSFSLTDKLSFTPGLLGIYHLDEDEYSDPLESISDIEGSAGLTINANLYFNVALNEKNSLNIITGFPVLVRENRPDGLTRSFVIGVEFQHLSF